MKSTPSSANKKPPFSFLRRVSKSFRRPFFTPRERKPTNELVITQEFVDQQLGTTTTQEGELINIDTTSPQDTGAIPKIKPTASISTPGESSPVRVELV
jgi:hypothetical protein